MTFPEAVKSAFKNYAKFDGRASRSEYWWFWLFEIIVLAGSMVLTLGDGIIANIGGLIYIVAALGMFLPSLGLLFRRLHDTDRSAWWILISLIPLVGGIVLLVFTVLDGTPGPNKFGPRPGTKGVADTFF
jgi:uncharacterized membrane protein YhaH (DUF805 family)